MLGHGVGDLLADLVLKGEKDGNCISCDLYAVDNDPLPQREGTAQMFGASQRSGCLHLSGSHKVLFSLSIKCQPTMPTKEGEGDKSLASWRQVHEEVSPSGWQAEFDFYLTARLFRNFTQGLPFVDN